MRRIMMDDCFIGIPAIAGVPASFTRGNRNRFGAAAFERRYVLNSDVGGR